MYTIAKRQNRSPVDRTAMFRAPRIIGMMFVLMVLLRAAPVTKAGTPVVGFTEPVKTIRLAASETGILESLKVNRGDRVMATQVIGALDTGVLRARRALSEARVASQSRLKSAEIKRKRAQHNFETLEQLRTEGHSGKRELELAASEFELAKIDLEAAREEAQLNQLDLSRIDAEIRRRTIVSPVDGVVTDVHHEVGEFVALSQPAVVTIADLSALRIRFYPSASYAESLKTGHSVYVRFAHSGKAFAARIDYVAPVIDADSNTIQIDVLLNNSRSSHQSGRRCTLEIDKVTPTKNFTLSLRQGERS